MGNVLTPLQEHLLQLSAQFYSTHAPSFAESRQKGWDAWATVWKHMGANGPVESVLDVGCGNGRFAGFLDSQGSDAAYCGIDSEDQLLAAGRRDHPDKEFRVGNVLTLSALDNAPDALVCFGVFHHIPGRATRAALLHRLGELVAPGAMVAVSLWQPAKLKNFASKQCEADSLPGLEPNDYLLGWKGDCSAPRYCHHFADDEIDELVDQSGLEPVTRFQGEGNDVTNVYVVLRRPHP